MNPQVDLKLNLKFHFNTDGRTDGLTKNHPTAATNSQVLDARARIKIGGRS